MLLTETVRSRTDSVSNISLNHKTSFCFCRDTLSLAGYVKGRDISVNIIFSKRDISDVINFSQRDISVKIIFSQRDISVNIIFHLQYLYPKQMCFFSFTFHTRSQHSRLHKCQYHRGKNKRNAGYH